VFAVKAKTVLVIRNLLFLITFIIGVIGLVMFIQDGIALENENAYLKQQLQALQQEKQDFKEGKYTLITNLSSSIYLNGIPASLEKEQWWEDVNGVKFCDVTTNGTHYRYVEGHIPIAQLPLYAPNLHVEVVSEKTEP
jgi:type II secretory pathway pseudopilin PulG